jgi:Na+/proline symporter
MTQQLNLTGAILFGIYLIGVAYLAYVGTKKTKDIGSFSIAKEDIGPWVAGITFSAAFASAGTFLGCPGQVYYAGYSGLWFTILQWFPTIIGLAVMAKGYRKISQHFKSLSVADWIGDRYNSEFLRVFVAVVTLLNIVYVGAQFVGVGIVMQSMFGISYEAGVAIGLAIVVAYVFFGGSYAHIYTNALQGALMVILGVIAFVAGFIVIPDFFTTVPAKLAAQDPNLVALTNPNDVRFASWTAIAGIGFAHLFWSANPHLVNKVQYLKTNRDVKKFIFISALSLFLMGIVSFTGLYAKVLSPGLKVSDAACPTFVNMAFPEVIGGFFLVVILAATMSTTDGILVYLGTIFGNTLYKQLYIGMKERSGVKIDREKVDKTALTISQWGVVLVGCIALPIAWKQPPFLIVLLWVASAGVLSTVMGPIIMGIWSRRATTTGAIISAVGGLTIYCILWFGGIVKSIFLCAGLGGIIGITLMIIGSYLSSPMPKEFTDRLFGGAKESA